MIQQVGVTVSVAPSIEPVTLEEVKAHLRVDFDDGPLATVPVEDRAFAANRPCIISARCPHIFQMDVCPAFLLHPVRAIPRQNGSVCANRPYGIGTGAPYADQIILIKKPLYRRGFFVLSLLFIETKI